MICNSSHPFYLSSNLSRQPMTAIAPALDCPHPNTTQKLWISTVISPRGGFGFGNI